MKIIDRKTAGDLGYKRFYTGVACKHGHIAERWVLNGACIACMNGSNRKCYVSRKTGMTTYTRNVPLEFIPQLDAMLAALELQHSIDLADDYLQSGHVDTSTTLLDTLVQQVRMERTRLNAIHRRGIERRRVLLQRERDRRVSLAMERMNQP